MTANRLLSSWTYSALKPLVLFIGLWATLAPIAGQAQESPKPPAEPISATSNDLKLSILWAHVKRLLNVEENPNGLFVRWEEPVRYYLQGLEDHPQLERLFKVQMAKLSQITGLEIKRHDDVYLNYKDPAKRETGPDGQTTDVAFFFVDNMREGFQKPKVDKIIKAFGDDPQKEYSFWKRHEQGESSGYSKRGYSRKGMEFFARISLKNKQNNIKNKNFKKREILIHLLSVVENVKNNSNLIESIYNDSSFGTRQLTIFDENFLKIYYSSQVKSGMTNLEAARKITRALGARFLSHNGGN